jgi:hypothetical protein
MAKKNKSEKTDATEKVNRKSFAMKLSMLYLKDLREIQKSFPDNLRLELLNHLLECVNIFEEYYANDKNPAIWKKFAVIEDAFYLKHRARLKLYNQKQLAHYFDPVFAITEKIELPLEQFNALPGEEQELKPQEIANIIFAVRNALSYERRHLLLESDPPDEQENTKELNGNGKKHVLKREAGDKLTCLNLGETVLLLYYLQQAHIFLKDEYLKDVDAGRAFEILTGYSKHTVRMNLGKASMLLTKANAKALENVLDQIKSLIKHDAH